MLRSHEGIIDECLVYYNHTEPNYFIHSSYFFKSSFPTDLFTFFNASMKSYLVNGILTYC